MSKYIKEKLDPATLECLAEFICGDDNNKFPIYRSSSFITKFFQDIYIFEKHDGSTRKWWVLEVLKKLSIDDLENVILRLVDIREYKGDIENLKMAQKSMSDILFMENLDIIFKGKDPVIIPLNMDSNPIIKSYKKDEDFKSEKKEDNMNNNIVINNNLSQTQNINLDIKNILENKLNGKQKKELEEIYKTEDPEEKKSKTLEFIKKHGAVAIELLATVWKTLNL